MSRGFRGEEGNLLATNSSLRFIYLLHVCTCVRVRVCVCVCVRACAMMHVWWSEDTLWVSPFTTRVLGIELRSDP